MEHDDSSQHNTNYQPSRHYIELVDGNKFIILYLMSLGLYAVWWMYKSWKFFQEKEEPNMMPAARAIFALFFAYSLFERILKYAKQNDYQSTYNSALLFIGFLILNMCGNLPDPLYLISFFSFIFLIPQVRALNFAIMNSDDYDGEEVDRYSARQMAIVAFGCIFWSLIILGLLSGEAI